MPPIRVLYIAGQGRSGSTLVDRVLGQTPGLVSCGEIFNWWQNFANPDQQCSCSKLVSECAFWLAVQARAFPEPPDIDAEWRAQRAAIAIRRSRLWPLPGSWRGRPTPAQRDVAKLPAQRKLTIAALTWPLLLRYRYPLWPPRSRGPEVNDG